MKPPRRGHCYRKAPGGAILTNPAVRTKVMRNWKVSKIKRQEEPRSVTNSGIRIFLRQYIKSKKKRFKRTGPLNLLF